MRCHIITAVWGSWHTDRFINVNLPSLLAAKNLPEFARKIELTYVIATRRSDSRTIRESPAYKLLREIGRVRLVTYRDSAFGHPIDTHKRIWLDAARSAARRKAFCVFNPADIAWPDGSFQTLAKYILAGKKVIYAMFGRVLDETFTPEALGHRDQTGILSVPPRLMIDMMLRHLHPYNSAYLRDSDQFPSHTEHVFWPVHGEGLLMRLLSALLLGLDPAEYQMNSDFLLQFVKDPQDIACIGDSDDLFGVSLAPLKKDQGLYSQIRPLDIDEIGAWWLTCDDPANLLLARTRFHFHAGGTHSPAWERARRKSDFFVLQAIASREIIRVGRLLKQNGCTLAAEIVATALYVTRLRRRWRWRPPVSIVVPNDVALAPYRQQIVSRLLAPGREKQLVDFVLAHVVRGKIPTDRSDTAASPFLDRATTLAGQVLDVARDSRGLTIDGERVTNSITLPLENQLIIVDGDLGLGKAILDGTASQ